MTFLRLLTVGLWYFVKRNRWNFLVIFALIGISGLGLYQSALDNLGADKAWWSGMWQNFGTEVIGAILTFTIFEMLINANNRQEALIRQMASSDNATARNAVNELRALGYLFDGTLRGKSLVSANLAGANLAHADFEGVSLKMANVADATLDGTNLKGADLSLTNLNDAQLSKAILDSHTILPETSTSQAITSHHITPHPYRALRAKRRLRRTS